jgi:hypothetical protein
MTGRFQAHPAEDLGQLVVGLGPEVRKLTPEPFEAPLGIHRGSIASEPFVFQAVDPESAPLRPAALIVLDPPEPGVLQVKGDPVRILEPRLGADKSPLDAGPQQPHRPGGVEPLVEEHASLHRHPIGAEGVPVGVLEPGAAAAQLSLDAGPQQPHRPGGVEPLVPSTVIPSALRASPLGFSSRAPVQFNCPLMRALSSRTAPVAWNPCGGTRLPPPSSHRR